MLESIRARIALSNGPTVIGQPASAARGD